MLAASPERASVVLALVGAAGCGRVGFSSASSDAQSMDIDATLGADASLPTRPFVTPPMPVTVLNSATEDDDPTLPADQLEIFFASDRSGDSEIYRAFRASTTSAWTVPMPVTEVNTASAEVTPEISRDGLTLHFARELGSYDIYVSTRASRTTPWSTPTLVTELSTPVDDDAAMMAPDGLTLVVTRYTTVDFDGLWIATRPTTSSPWSTPVRVTDLDEPGIIPNQAWLGEAVIYYTANSPVGDQELRAALRMGQTGFGPSVPITELDLVGQQSDPWLSSDLETIYFESQNDIYMTTRTP